MRAKDYSSQAIRIPAPNCLHYQEKRCLKDVAPTAEHKCTLLGKRVEWARRFARRLKELRRLRPPQKRETVIITCGNLFRENLAEMEYLKCDLIDKSPGNLNDCSHFHRKMCLLRLPLCPGRCTDYLRRPDEKELVS